LEFTFYFLKKKRIEKKEPTEIEFSAGERRHGESKVKRTPKIKNNVVAMRPIMFNYQETTNLNKFF